MKNKGFFILLTLCIFGSLLLCNSSESAPAQLQSASQGNAGQGILPGSRLRVVWVQDMGDGRDVDTVGSNLRLMGLDTADVNGERPILGVGNYTKPLITPRGDRVVYTDRIRKKIYVVNWDGSGRRELFVGFGLAVWRDPANGREWVYYGFEEMQKGGLTCPAVYRAQLDHPDPGELIWNQKPVNVDSFQLSADGRLAGGNYPWPDGGVADLPGKSIEIFTKGCWPALATDRGKSYYWIFDGAHRNLAIFDLPSKRKRQVNINGAPGIDGHEVYHPRWSNHYRIMAMTGPYKVGSGANRIAGGGREVEIFVGRFNAGLTKIESWLQITRNDRADFFPDVWVAPTEAAKPYAAKSPGVTAAAKKRGSPGVAPARSAGGSETAVLKRQAAGKASKRLVVDARLTEPSGIPSPRDITPYRRALVVNAYEVVRVISGSYGRKRLMAAHWVIEDATVLQEAIREKGKTYRMILERYDDHPELEGERLVMDSDEFKLPLYYELRN